MATWSYSWPHHHVAVLINASTYQKKDLFSSALSNTASFSDVRQNRASSKLRKETGIALPEFKREREDATEPTDFKS